MQKKQDEWLWQWSRYNYERSSHSSGDFLFEEWIWPNTLESFRKKSVLDCGAGSGDHLLQLAPVIAKGVGIDLNAAPVARERLRQHPHISIIEGDIATVDVKERFDIVYSIGVLHHTDEPRKSFENIKRFTRPGGRLIIWVYSREGNFLNRTILEFAKRAVLLRLPKRMLAGIGHVLTGLLYPIIYTVYLLPLPFLPFYEYFQNWRRLSYSRNFLNVFDKLNAPTTHFISRQEIEKWFGPEEFSDIHISAYKGVSWRASGTVSQTNQHDSEKDT